MPHFYVSGKNNRKATRNIRQIVVEWTFWVILSIVFIWRSVSDQSSDDVKSKKSVFKMILYRNVIRSKYLGADMRGMAVVAIFVATYPDDSPQKLTQIFVANPGNLPQKWQKWPQIATNGGQNEITRYCGVL
jgi:hypothetical protein